MNFKTQQLATSVGEVDDSLASWMPVYQKRPWLERTEWCLIDVWSHWDTYIKQWGVLDAAVWNIDVLCLKSFVAHYVTYLLILNQWKVMGHRNICMLITNRSRSKQRGWESNRLILTVFSNLAYMKGSWCYLEIKHKPTSLIFKDNNLSVSS